MYSAGTSYKNAGTVEMFHIIGNGNTTTCASIKDMWTFLPQICLRLCILYNISLLFRDYCHCLCESLYGILYHIKQYPMLVILYSAYRL